MPAAALDDRTFICFFLFAWFTCQEERKTEGWLPNFEMYKIHLINDTWFSGGAWNNGTFISFFIYIYTFFICMVNLLRAERRGKGVE